MDLFNSYKNKILWFVKYSSTETQLRMNLMGYYGPTKLDDETYNAALDELMNTKEIDAVNYLLPDESETKRIFFPKGTSIVIGR